MCLGCIFLAIAAFAPRVGVGILWLFTDLEQKAFFGWPLGAWFWTLLGLIFLPWTTLIFILVSSAMGGMSLFAWLLVGIGLVMDLGQHFQTYQDRDKATAVYGQYAGGTPK
jgi:hypothetical protein